MLNEKDYVLVGAFIVLFSYIDFNLRRVTEVFDKTGRLSAPWKGKIGNLNAVEVAAAIQSLDCWDDAGVRRFKMSRSYENSATWSRISRLDGFRWMKRSCFSPRVPAILNGSLALTLNRVRHFQQSSIAIKCAVL